MNRQAVGAEQVDESRGRVAVAVGELPDAEVRQQQWGPRGRAVRAQQGRVVEQRAAGAEDERDAVFGGGVRERTIDGLGLGRAAGHRRHDERCGEVGAEQLGAEVDRSEVAAGQRAVAQPHGVQTAAGAVLNAGAGRDPQMLGLAAGGVGECGHDMIIRAPRRSRSTALQRIAPRVRGLTGCHLELSRSPAMGVAFADGVGHCPPLDVPLETAQLILEFTG